MAEAFGLGDLRESRFSEAVSGADSGVDVSLGVGGGLRKTGLPLISIVDVSKGSAGCTGHS